MIEKIRDVNDVVSNMAAITEEQSASAEEIEATAVNIQELADTVSENSADVHEDSNELAMTADTLKQHISQFIEYVKNTRDFSHEMNWHTYVNQK